MKDIFMTVIQIEKKTNNLENISVCLENIGSRHV